MSELRFKKGDKAIMKSKNAILNYLVLQCIEFSINDNESICAKIDGNTIIVGRGMVKDEYREVIIVEVIRPSSAINYYDYNGRSFAYCDWMFE